MPIGEGYWLHWRTGKYLEIYEHLSEVLHDPKVFGLRPEAVAPHRGEDAATHRERVLRTVLEKGWIRVRSAYGHTVFEFHELTRRVADAIWTFTVDVLGAGPMSSFSLNEVSSGRSFTVRTGSFYDDVEQHLAGAGAAAVRTRAGEQLYLLGMSVGQGRQGR